MTNYFDFTNNLTSLDKVMLYIVAIDNKDCLESLSNYFLVLIKYKKMPAIAL